MSAATRGRLSWTVVAPVVGLVVLAAAWGRHPGAVIAAVIAVFLVGAVLAAVHHAEVVAHRVGEPFGSLILAVAVTVIEVALIVTLMVSRLGQGHATLARDTVFAAVMISANGIVGLALLVGALRHHLATFNPEGTGSALATVIDAGLADAGAAAFTTSTPGPEFSASQLAFAAVASLALYALFVFTQTVRHRDFFLPVEPTSDDRADGDGHADPPSARAALVSLGLLARRAGRRGRPRQGRVAGHRGRRGRARIPRRVGRCRDRAAGPAAGVDRRRTRGRPRPTPRPASTSPTARPWLRSA